MWSAVTTEAPFSTMMRGRHTRPLSDEMDTVCCFSLVCTDTNSPSRPLRRIERSSRTSLEQEDDEEGVEVHEKGRRGEGEEGRRSGVALICHTLGIERSSRSLRATHM
jgi:hypothetical protein